MLSLFSSRWNWDSPNPSPAGECAPPFGSRGGAYSLARGGMGGPDSNEGTLCSVYSRYVLCGGQYSSQESKQITILNKKVKLPSKEEATKNLCREGSVVNKKIFYGGMSN